MRSLSGPHVPIVLNLSLKNISLLRTGAVSVWELLEEEQAGAGSQAVLGVEESFPPSSREEPALDKTSNEVQRFCCLFSVSGALVHTSFGVLLPICCST